MQEHTAILMLIAVRTYIEIYYTEETTYLCVLDDIKVKFFCTYVASISVRKQQDIDVKKSAILF